MGLLPTYLVKSAYYCYCYCITIAYYLSPCLVKKKEIGKILSSLDDTIITQEKLSENSIKAYHDRTAKIEGTMQWRTKEWQVQYPGKRIPFEQRYRLWFLHKVLAREQRNLAPTIELVLRQKQAIIKITLEKLMSIDLPPIIFKDIMEYTFPSTYQCQYYFLETHYTRLSKLTRLSHDYTPCYYLLLSSSLLFQWYYLIKHVLGEVKKHQFNKRPLKLYKPYKTIYYDSCITTVNRLGKQINQRLSLCNSYAAKTNNGNLKRGIEKSIESLAIDTKNFSNVSNKFKNHAINKKWGTLLAKALISQNSTAVTLAINDLSFHGIHKNDIDGCLSVPFVGSWLVDEEKGLPLTTTDFCEQAFFAPDWLADHIDHHIKVALLDNLKNIETSELSQRRSDLIYSFVFAVPIFIFLAYNAFRRNLAYHHDFIHGFVHHVQQSIPILILVGYIYDYIDPAPS